MKQKNIALVCLVSAAVASMCYARPEFTLALFSASSTNSGYPQVMLDDMRAAGYSGFRMVGSRCKKPELGDAAAWYDGYGGFTCKSFLTQYKVSEEEYNNVQDAAEREQLMALGMPKKIVHEWQRALLRSPLVRFRGGGGQAGWLRHFRLAPVPVG